MAIATSATDIANLAIDIIKQENISNVEVPGTDKIAAVANRWYDDVRQALLEEFPWNWATKRGVWSKEADPPIFDDDARYDASYQIPADYMSLSFIEREDLPLSQWDYTIEGLSLLLRGTTANSIKVGYAYDVTDVTRFTPTFRLYLAAELAKAIVFKLTGSVGLTNRVEGVRKAAELKAKAANGRANPPRAYRAAKSTVGRRNQGGRYNGGSQTSEFYI